MDHRELEMCLGVVERHAAVLAEEDCEEGDRDEDEGERVVRPGAAVIAAEQSVQRRVAGQQDEESENREDDRLNEGRELALAARAHAFEGAAGIEGAKDREEASRAEEIEE